MCAIACSPRLRGHAILSLSVYVSILQCCIALQVFALILQGDIILVGLRDYQDEKADVILK